MREDRPRVKLADVGGRGVKNDRAGRSLAGDVALAVKPTAALSKSTTPEYSDSPSNSGTDV
jgi:hypothetical protein